MGMRGNSRYVGERPTSVTAFITRYDGLSPLPHSSHSYKIERKKHTVEWYDQRSEDYTSRVRHKTHLTDSCPPHQSNATTELYAVSPPGA